MSAEDKKTCNKNKITITNDQGRLSKDEIEQMVKDAEKYTDEDKTYQERITAKNGLESYCFSMKQSVEGDLKDKLDAEDKEKIEEVITTTIKWLEDNSLKRLEG